MAVYAVCLRDQPVDIKVLVESTPANRLVGGKYTRKSGRCPGTAGCTVLLIYKLNHPLTAPGVKSMMLVNIDHFILYEAQL